MFYTTTTMATSKKIIAAFAQTFEDKAYALAMWQGGAASFNRTDEWSDLDLMLIVNDGMEQEAMNQTVWLLQKEFGIDTKFDIDPPHWPGMTQTFFRLKNTSPFLLIDFSILPVSATSKFAEPEIHGQAVVIFDKPGIIANTAPVDEAQLRKTLRARILLQRKKQELFWVMVDKEINRQSGTDAFIFYWSYTVAPLIEMLRIKHSPHHWNFGSRYLSKHLPADIATRLQALFFVKDLPDLIQKNKEARVWFSLAAQEAEESLL